MIVFEWMWRGEAWEKSELTLGLIDGTTGWWQQAWRWGSWRGTGFLGWRR